MTWQTINETLNRRQKKREYPQEFKLSNGDTISDPNQIAEVFNNYLVSIGSPDSQITMQNKEYKIKQHWYLIQLQKNQLCTLLIV